MTSNDVYTSSSEYGGKEKFSLNDWEKGLYLALSLFLSVATFSGCSNNNGRNTQQNTQGNILDSHYSNKIGLDYYPKDGKIYIIGNDGIEYELKSINNKSYEISDKSYLFDDKPGEISIDSLCLLLGNGDKSYYFFDGELHELKGKYNCIVAYGKSPDGRNYFVGGNNGSQTLEIEGKILGPLDVICGIGTMNGTDYILGYRGMLEYNIDKLKPVKRSETGDNNFKPDDYVGIWSRIHSWPGTSKDFCVDK